jgi:hypothetical protein
MFILPQFQFFRWKSITVSAVVPATVTYDTYFNYTSLLINAESSSTGVQNVTFIDSSTNAVAITPTGSPTQTSLTPYTPNDWGVQFDGVSRLTVPAGSNFAYGLGAFTIEAWVNPISYSNGPIIFGQTASSHNYFVFGINSSGQLYFIGAASGTGTSVAATSGFIPLNQWTHVALVREGSASNQLKFYVNGILAGISTTSVNFSNTTYLPSIGMYTHAVQLGFTGSISNLRVVKGQALYTGNFTPSVSAFTTYNVGGYGNVVPALTGTVSLLACQNNRFKDNSSANLSLTATGSPRVGPFNPFRRFTNASYSMYSTGSQYLSLPASTDFSPGTGTFTTEAWVNVDTFTTSSILIAIPGSISFYISDTGTNLALSRSYDANLAKGAFTFQTKTWYHVAVTRNGGIIEFFVNGNKLTTSYITASATIATKNFTQDSTVGAAGFNGRIKYENSATWTGYMSNIRMIKGQVLYTGTFTPASAALTTTTVGTSGANVASSLTGTVALLALQDSNVLIDNSPSPKTITATGTPYATKNTPFMDTNVYLDNYSNYFNGSTNSITVPASFGTSLSGLALTKSTFECWICPTQFLSANSYTHSIFNNSPAVVANGRITIAVVGSVSGTGNLFFQWTTSTTTASSMTTTNSLLSVNKWSHIAVVIDPITNSSTSATISLYVDGVNSLTRTANISASHQAFYTPSNFIGRPAGGGSNWFTGYISNFKVTKECVYTSNFTPSVSPLTTRSQNTNPLNVLLLACKDSQHIDVSNYGNALTVSSPAPLITRGQIPFTDRNIYYSDSYSIYFNGSSYLTTPYLTSYYWNTSDFTIDLWVYVSQAPSSQVFLFGNSNPTGGQVNWNIVLETDMRVGFYYWTGAGRYTYCPEKMKTGSWNHVAFSHVSGSGFKVYVNGIGNPALTAIVGTPSQGGVGTLTLGAFANTFAPSGTYVSNLRVVRGSALYTTNFTPPIAPLSAVAGTQLLLKNNTFVDESPSPKTITSVGSPIINDFSPFPTVSAVSSYTPVAYNPSTHGGSIYLNGTSSRLALPSNSNFTLSTGDFTIECWYYPTGSYTYPVALELGNHASGGVGFFFQNNSSLVPFVFANVSYAPVNTGSIILNSWNHIVYQRQSGTLKIFVNGVGSNGLAFTNNFGLPATVTIGSVAAGAANYYAFGYMSDFRVVKGTALYTTNFTPPSAPLAAVAGTQLLLKGNNGAIVDATNKNIMTITGSVSASPTVVQMGSKSLYFDGSTSYITIPHNDTVNLSGVDFTIEARVYWTDSGTNAFIINKDGVQGSKYPSYGFYINNSILLFSHNSGTYSINTGYTFPKNVWKHIAATKSGNNTTIFVDGSAVASSTTATIGDQAGSLWLGYQGGSVNTLFKGYIDEVRITKGINRYAGLSTFTVPTTAYPTQ